MGWEDGKRTERWELDLSISLPLYLIDYQSLSMLSPCPLCHGGPLQACRRLCKLDTLFSSRTQWMASKALAEDLTHILSWKPLVSEKSTHSLFFFSHILKLWTLRNHFSSVAQSRLTLCDLMNRSTPGLPVHHQLPEFTQTHVHRVSDDIQPSHPLSFPSPPASNPSQHQSLFQ